MDDDWESSADRDWADDDATTQTSVAPAVTTSTTATEVAQGADPPAWELFLLFIFGSILAILACRWIINRCCGGDPRPSGPPLHAPGKFIARMTVNGQPGNPKKTEIEMDLLADNDSDEDTTVFDRESKIK
tara:strand:- start:491 stop:883 length:393 start_codon:yes stop_codon:yes gene_type:complete